MIILTNSRTKWIAFTAMYVSLIWTQEMILIIIPNIQLTTLLIVLYVTHNKFKESALMILIYVILDNMQFGFSIFMLPMYLGWMIIPIAYEFIHPKNEYQHAALGILFAFLYSWMYIPFGLLMYGYTLEVYLLADIKFEIYLAISNFTTILVLYKPLSEIFSIFDKKYSIEKDSIEDENILIEED